MTMAQARAIWNGDNLFCDLQLWVLGVEEAKGDPNLKSHYYLNPDEDPRHWME